MISVAAILTLTPVIEEAHNIMGAHAANIKDKSYLNKVFKLRAIREDFVVPFIRNTIKTLNCVSIKAHNIANNDGALVSGNDALNSVHFDNICVRAFSDYNPSEPGCVVLNFLTYLSNEFDVDVAK